MTQTFAINGSPRAERGNTAMLLAPFLQGMQEAGSGIALVYASHLHIRPCACGELYCWNKVPGECCFKDDMQRLYPQLRAADILVLATPVYIPLPGDMQNFLNRLVALLDPVVEFRGERTRARFRPDVRIRKVVLVATSGWWEKANFGTVTRIVEELAADAGVEFAGAVLRPHVWLMQAQGELTPDGQAVLDATRQAGFELVSAGAISPATLETISHPLISQEELWRLYEAP